MSTKHTQGPWFEWHGHIYAGTPSEMTYSSLAGHRATICQLGDDFDDDDISEEEREANASLIAAAPTMYEYIASSASNGCHEAQKILEAINAGR